jgi:hypothetical protein
MQNRIRFERLEMDQLRIFNFSSGYNFYRFYYVEVYPPLLADL